MAHSADADVAGDRARTGSGLAVLAPLSIEALVLRLGLREARVVRTGWGAQRARAAARHLSMSTDRALAIAGVCGALDPELAPGDVIVASELLGGAGAHKLADAEALLDALRALGARARLGPILSVDQIARGRGRERLRESGALATDMESRWLAEAARGRPFSVLRVVVDTPARELLRPSAILDGVRALATLRRVAPALEAWWRSILQPG
ncbi:MAG TPA: 1-hydroxy-2-methyl-2-butenyl 4-diphosphate reductase [Myxococcota bacterium]|nr:1-hydroxy-2-methyl-2-butenyl 4-diphosphate reductase [Myxococcota bacterium]